jgi:hypothetical protein
MGGLPPARDVNPSFDPGDWMSETKRNAGRTAWLLSSASGAVLLAGMAVMTPEQVLAADECGAVAVGQGNNSSADVRSCGNAATLNNGVTYSQNGNQTDAFTLVLDGTQVNQGVKITNNNVNGGTVQVNTNVVPAPAVTVTNGRSFNGDAAIDIQTAGTNAAVTINHNAGSISGGGGTLGFHDGIRVRTSGSNAAINVTTGEGTSVSATTGSGMVLRATGGAPITVNVDGSVTSTYAPLGIPAGYGIDAQSSGGNGGVAIHVLDDGTVSGTLGGIKGQAAGSGNVVISTAEDRDVTATSALLGIGIQGTSVNGNVDIDIGEQSDIAGGLNGIRGEATGNGSVYVTTLADSTVTATGTPLSSAIRGITTSGTVDIGTGENSTITGELAGIWGSATSGTVYITTNSSNVSSGLLGTAVRGTTVNGVADLRIEGSSTISGGLFGVSGEATGTGTVYVSLENGSTVSAEGVGLNAAVNNGSAYVSVEGDVNDALVGVAGTSVGSGNVNIDVYGRSDINTVLDGVAATASGSGNINVNVGGDITTTSAVGHGIVARSIAGGTGSISIDTYSRSDIETAGDGIAAYILNSNSSGVISIETEGDIHTTDAASAAIRAENSGSGLTEVRTYARTDITGAGNGVVATGETIALYNDGDIATTGTEYVINAGSGNAVLTNGSWGDINEGGDTSKLVVDNTGGLGSLTIDNYGAIYGRFTLNDANNVVNNYSYDSWHTSGETIFGAGNNTLENSGAIHAGADGATILNFGDGADVFNNSGLFFSQGLTTTPGLETFNAEGGAIVMEWPNDAIGDVIDMSTAVYNNTGDADLYVDAELGAPGAASDMLKLGSVSGGGTTQVWVDDHGGLGAYNPTGVAVVEVADSSAQVGDFVLGGGPINKGLWDYDMFLDNDGDTACGGNGCFVLASYASASAYAVSQFTGLAQGVWNTTADSWIDRAGDLRVSSQQGPGDPTKKSGLWGRFIGNGAERSTEKTITPFQNQSVTIDTGYDQSLWGFQAGIDHEFEGSVADGVLIAGVLGGYVSSNVNFNSGDSVKMSGPQVGVYATWVKGGFYVDGLVKGDFLTADYNVAGSDSDTDSTTIGVRVETGYRYTGATGMFIEPNASLAYAHTSVDDITIDGTAARFDDGDGWEGKLGARFGSAMLKDGIKYDPYLSVAVAGNFASDNSVFFSSGPGLVVEDDAPDVFGEVGAGINIFSTKSGWTGFASADLRFGDDYVGGTGKIGANWAW